MADDKDLKGLDERTVAFIKAEQEAGRPVANIGTFRVVDDEGHIEVIDPAGPPGTILYDRFNKDGLVEHAMTRVVAGDLDLKGASPADLKKEQLVAALENADKGSK